MMLDTTNPVLEAILAEQRAIEEDWARLDRRRTILKELAVKAAALDEAFPPQAPPKLSAAPAPEPELEAAPEPEPEPEPAPEPEPEPEDEPIDVPVERKPDPVPEAPQRTTHGNQWDASETDEKITAALAELGPMHQNQIATAIGMNKSTVSDAVRRLSGLGKIVEGPGKARGGAKFWQVPDAPSTAATPPISPRVRKALDEEQRAKRSRKPTQGPTLAGRILSALVLGDQTTRELAVKLSVPQPTVERIAETLREEGDVALTEGGKWRRLL